MSDEGTKTELPWIKSPNGVIDVYSNSIHVTWSLDDVRIRLAQVVDNPETPNPGLEFSGVNQERAAITLSWRMAKVLRDQLTIVITAFEKKNGQIKTDVELTAL
jgi:hypothetical protein